MVLFLFSQKPPHQTKPNQIRVKQQNARTYEIILCYNKFGLEWENNVLLSTATNDRDNDDDSFINDNNDGIKSVETEEDAKDYIIYICCREIR